MPLEAGQKLGPYEILAPIGKGGMGEVYRARDAKLEREVAIKVLPEEFAEDGERLARFEREAKLLASLNHPNIASIYGFESGALVLELVEGPTLADRIAEGAIPLDEALAIAKQVAVALEAAHDQGVIHRDLKPANVKVTPDGVVKVLDFGLAKALESERGGDASESPTLATAVTGMGMIIGTAAYMSPEQARGKPVDRRADVWAFGVVVLEMLTGKRVFDAEDVSLTLAEVMKSEPDWETLPGDVSPVLRRFLEHCLRKDPKERVRDIGDVRLAMEGAFETEPTPVTTAYGPTGRAAPALLAMLVAAVTGLVVWTATRSDAPAPKLTRTSIVLPQSHIRYNTGRRGIAVSPDGAHVVYVANEQLYLRAVDELDAEPIEGTEGSLPTLPFLSPDGQWVGFFSTRDTELQKVALSGGASVSLCSAQNPYGASWDLDDTIVFGQGRNGILRVAAAGGTPEVLVASQEGEILHGPQMLPGGERVLFTSSQFVSDEGRIVAQTLSTGERRTLVQGGTDARYLATGHLVYALEGNLFAVPFDVDRLEVAGGPVPLVGDVVHAGTTPGVNFDVSRDGMLVYLTGTAVALRTPVWVDRDGREEPTAAEPRDYRTVRVSPDGAHAVLDAADGEQDLWIWDFSRETMTRLTFEPGGDQGPVWTPDGHSVVYTSGEGREIYRKAADGTGVAERLKDSSSRLDPLAITPDGNRIVLHEFAGGAHALAVLVLEGEPVVEPLVDNGFLVTNADLSPDGRWLVYETNASSDWEIYVRPFPVVDSGRWQISRGGGEYPLWGRDGRELFYSSRNRDRDLMRVAIETDPVFRPGNPELIIERGAYYNDRFRRSFDISPDGRRFLMLKDVDARGDDDSYAGLNRIIVVQNWFEELNARVPVE